MGGINADRPGNTKRFHIRHRDLMIDSFKEVFPDQYGGEKGLETVIPNEYWHMYDFFKKEEEKIKPTTIKATAMLRAVQVLIEKRYVND
jgi:hypothetical protein